MTESRNTVPGTAASASTAPPGPRLTVVHAMRYHFPMGWHFPPDIVPYSMVRLITSGHGVFTVDGDDRAVAPGDVCLIPEGTDLECRSSSPDLSFISVRFATTLTVGGDDLLAEAFSVPMVSHPADDATMLAHFEAAEEVWRHATPARSFLATGHLHLILGTLLAEAHTGSAPVTPQTTKRRRVAPRAHDPRIERVMDHIDRTGRATADLPELCALAHMSESTLRRQFKEYTGKTLGDYLRDQRMVSAARALLLTDASIGEISAEMGFHDANYFTRTFRKVYGTSPVAYRRAARQG